MHCSDYNKWNWCAKTNQHVMPLLDKATVSYQIAQYTVQMKAFNCKEGKARYEKVLDGNAGQMA